MTIDLERDLIIPAGLDEGALLEMYRIMLLARALDERAWLLNRAGKAPFAVPSQGHEAAQVGAAFALTPGKDFILPYYRGLTIALVFGLTPYEYMLGVFARAADPCSGGRQMPAHYSARDRRIVTRSSVVGTQIPHAAGIALAEKIRGGDAVAWTSFGEGTTSQGDFHEGMNFAAIHKLPVIFQCENNGYAISVPIHAQMPVAHVADRAAAYAIPGVSIDGADPLAVYCATREAAARARAGDGPTLIEARCVRLTPHSSDDNDRLYRPADELATLRAHDPIARFAHTLSAAGILDEEQDRALHDQVATMVNDAAEAAERAPSPAPDTLYAHVYADT
jgi:2-oxoisovalerate dehydrogenase E1 component alpha subunit